LGNNLRDIVYWKNVNTRDELQRLIEEAMAKIGYMTGISCRVSGITGDTRLL
jgi:hypothetical protein